MDCTRLVTAVALLCFANSPLALAEQTPVDSPPQQGKSFAEIFDKGPQEEDIYRTDRMLVAATGSQKPVHLAPSVASVLTADDLKAMGATTLDEALENVPGFHASKATGAWFSSLWSIRGLHTTLNPQVLLLINGVPFTSNFTGARPFTYQMPVAMISRIEVVRGPGSALYGADAFAGVVNVITKDNFEIDGNASGLRYGSFDTVDAWAQHGGQYHGWDLALGLEWQKTQGDNDRVIDKDSLYFINQSAKSLAPGPLDTRRELLDSHLNLRKQDWNLHLYSTLQQSAVGTGAAYAVTYGNQYDAKSLLTDLSYQNDHQFADWELGGRAYCFTMNGDASYQYYPPAYLNMLGNPIIDLNDGGLEANAVYQGFSSHKLRLGVGAKNADFEPDQYRNFGAGVSRPYGDMVHIPPELMFMPSANRHFWYGMIQDEWYFARHWTLTAGLRYDQYSDFGGTTNPRTALVWETSPELTTKLMYGQAFRAPNFGELYTTNNPVNNGNPTNVPEEIETSELAFDYQPARDLRLIVSLFTYGATGLIDTANRLYSNMRAQDGKGFEIETDWQARETVRLRANFSYQRSEDATTRAVVTDAPELQAYLNPSWAFRQDWSLDGHFTWIGGRHRAQADPRAAIADYELVDLVLRKKKIAKHWEAAVSVRNLFDEDARIPSPYMPGVADGSYIPYDYPMEGRALWAEVSCHF